MKKRLTMVKAWLLVLCMAISLVPATVFAVDSPEEPKETITYVSIGDSMTNGYGLEGYNGSSGIVNYANDTYANQFAAWLAGFNGDIVDDQVIFEGDKAIVDHRQLAMSGLRAEDLHWILEFDYNDEALVNKIIDMGWYDGADEDTDPEWDSWGRFDSERWYDEFGFVTGDYRTFSDVVDPTYRFGEGASRVLRTYHSLPGNSHYFQSSFATPELVAAATAGINSSGYYPDNLEVPQIGAANFLRIGTEFFQESVADADVISLALGNTNFGTYMLTSIMNVVMSGDTTGFTNTYDIERVFDLADMNPTMEAAVRRLIDECDVVIDQYFSGLAGGDAAKAEALRNIIVYCITSYMVNYIGSVDAILTLKEGEPVDIIQVALMNAYAVEDETVGDAVTLGDIVDILYTPVNAFIAALPTVMQATGNELYKNANFYYAEADTVGCMVEVFGDDFYKDGNTYVEYNGLLNGGEEYTANIDSTVRDRFVEEIVEGQTFAMMNQMGLDVATDLTVAEIAAYDMMTPAQKAAYAASDADRAKSIALYLAFENAHIRAGEKTVTMDSLAALSGLEAAFGGIVSGLQANATAYGVANYLDAAAAVVAAGANSLQNAIPFDTDMVIALTEKGAAADNIIAEIAYPKATAGINTQMHLELSVDQVKALYGNDAAYNGAITAAVDMAIDTVEEMIYETYDIDGTVANLCYLLGLPQTLSNTMVSNPTLSGILCMNARCIIGTGIGGHPSYDGHDAVYNAMTASYEDEYTSKDKTMENAQIVLDELYALLEQYGPELMEKGYAYAVENGYIAKLEAAVETMKTELEAKTKEFVETAKPAIEAQIAELKAELAALEAELKDLYDALEAKKAELEAQLNKAEADASAAIKQAIANIEAMIAEIENAIATVEATIKSVSAMIDTLEAKLKALEGKLADLTTAIKTLEEALDALMNAVENAGGMIDSAVAAYEAARKTALAAIDTVETLYRQVATVVNEINAIAGKISDKVDGAYEFVVGALDAAYAALTEKVGAEIEAQLQALESKLEAKKAEVEAAVKAVTEKLWAAAEGEIAELEAAIAAKKAELESAVGAAKAELEAQLAALEAELAAKKAELETAVNNAKAEIEAAIAALEAELAAKKAELETAVGEAKAQLEAQIAELEAAIAAKKAELEAAVNAAKAELEAQIAALEAEIAKVKAELETAVNNAKAEIEAAIAALEAELAAKKAAVEAAVKAEVEKLWAAAEEEIAKLEAEIAELKAKLDAAVGAAKAELEAQIAALEAEVKAVIETVEAMVEKAAQEALAAAAKQVGAVIDFANAKIDEIIGAVEDAYVGATTDEYEVGEDSYYVALGDGSAVSASYVDQVAAALEVPFKNLAVDGQTIGKAPAHIVANAAEIQKADLITVGYGNNTFAENAFDRAVSALLGDPVETYDWVALIGAEGAAYVEQTLADIKADLVASGMDVTLTAYGFETDLASAVTLAVEAYAYATVEYLYALPTVIGTIREINPDAVVAIVGMYNPMDEVTLTFEDVSINIGEYLANLVEGADVYGTGFCMLFPNAIYVSAPDAETEVTANDYNMVNFLFRYMNGRVDMDPNADGHEYIYQQIMNALTVSEAPVVATLLGDVNLDGLVDAKDLTALARHIALIEELTDPVALKNGEVTGDGELTAEDLTHLARYIARIIPSL